MTGLEDALDTAEQMVPQVVDENLGVASDGLGCWAEADQPVDGSAELTGAAYCGPSLFPDSDPDEFWLTFDLDLDVDVDSDSGDVQATPGDPTLTSESSTVATERGQAYVHPSGREMPAGSGFDIPPPPPVDEDFLGQQSGSTSDELDTPEDEVIGGGEFTLEVSGVGTLDTVTISGGLHGPPDGHDLVALDLVAEENREGLRMMRVQVGDEEPVEVTPAGSFVVAAPTDAPVTLIVEEDQAGDVDQTSEPITQRYDVRSGELIDQVDVYYRNTEGDPIASEDIPCEWTALGVRVGYDDEPCTEGFSADVRLEYTVADSDISIPGLDEAVLVVDSTAGSMTLELPDGTELTPANDHDGSDGSTQNQWYFVAPADFEEATMTTVSKFDSDIGRYRVGVPHEFNVSVQR